MFFLSVSKLRARLSSVIEHQLMVRWVVGSIPPGGPIELFLFYPVPHNWCVKATLVLGGVYRGYLAANPPM